MGLCVCISVRGSARRQSRSVPWDGGVSTEGRRERGQTRDTGRELSRTRSTGRRCERNNFLAPKCDGSRREPPASQGSDSGDPEIAHLEVGRPQEAAGSICISRDEAGQAGAAQAPVPDSAGAAAGLIDALLTTEATQMTNAGEGCRRGRRRLCRLPLGLSESMEFITLTLFPLSEGQLFSSAALQIRSQPLAGAGSRHRDFLGQRWERKPLAHPRLTLQPLS